MSKNNFFISLKWIFLGALFLPSFAFSSKLIDVHKYVHDYEAYNAMVLNKQVSKPIQAPVTRINDALIKTMKVHPKKSMDIATSIHSASTKYKIDPRIMIAIMKVESNFNQNAVNTFSCKRTKAPICGDHSIAQINYEVWSKDFPKFGRVPLDYNRLKKDQDYAIHRMGEILSILKSRHSKEVFWFTRYHSSTDTFRSVYTAKVRKEMKKIIDLTPQVYIAVN